VAGTITCPHHHTPGGVGSYTGIFRILEVWGEWVFEGIEVEVGFRVLLQMWGCFFVRVL
jgi:hypothetical protein